MGYTRRVLVSSETAAVIKTNITPLTITCLHFIGKQPQALPFLSL